MTAPLQDPWGLNPPDHWTPDVEAGLAELARRGTPGWRYRLRVTVQTPVARGSRSAGSAPYARELDPETTAVLVARVGYDELNRELQPGTAGADPVTVLLSLIAAHRDPLLAQAAVWTDQLTGSAVSLRIVGEPWLLGTQPLAA